MQTSSLLTSRSHGAKLIVIFPATALLALSLASAIHAQPAQDNRAPDVPAALQVGDTNKVEFHAYAIGVQIYVCTPSATDPTKFSWVFKAPEAVLFDSDGDVVGIHYAGPTWETESGSKVVGQRVAGVTVDPTAIPWLLLAAKTAEGPGVLARTTYVQRVNTVGGIAPATGADAAHAGQEAHVPYTAEYFFYREE